jgi:hypothetical protein
MVWHMAIWLSVFLRRILGRAKKPRLGGFGSSATISSGGSQAPTHPRLDLDHSR